MDVVRLVLLDNESSLRLSRRDGQVQHTHTIRATHIRVVEGQRSVVVAPSHLVVYFLRMHALVDTLHLSVHVHVGTYPNGLAHQTLLLGLFSKVSSIDCEVNYGREETRQY